jgi:ubiquinone biosynthesis monooxygenase Coq7
MNQRALYQDNEDQAWLIAELRSDHAGETGAVWIYRGVLAVSRDEQVRQFAERHLATEEKHLGIMNELLSKKEQSWCLPLWRASGFLLGAIPALFGARVVFVTINAVETFVETHYRQQIERLQRDGLDELAGLLSSCMEEEIEHQREAAELMGSYRGRFDGMIRWVVGSGSSAAVSLARII